MNADFPQPPLGPPAASSSKSHLSGALSAASISLLSTLPRPTAPWLLPLKFLNNHQSNRHLQGELPVHSRGKKKEHRNLVNRTNRENT